MDKHVKPPEEKRSEGKMDAQSRVSDDRHRPAASREHIWPRILEGTLATMVGGLITSLGAVLLGGASAFDFGALAAVIGGGALLVMLTTLFFARLHRPSPDVERLKARIMSANAGAARASVLKPRPKE